MKFIKKDTSNFIQHLGGKYKKTDRRRRNDGKQAGEEGIGMEYKLGEWA